MAIGAALVVLVSAAPASAGFLFDPARVDAPWCLAHTDRSGIVECSFYTFQQCLETRSGVGGGCEPNPAYRPAAEQRYSRRHRR
jgi:hypothetical protein